MSKVGRNEPCPCGSGKKYKKCHGSALATGAAFERAASAVITHAHVQRIQRERQQGLGRPIISVKIGDRRVVAVRNRLLHSKGWVTFHDFLMDYIQAVLGAAWAAPELQKPLSDRHPVLQWHDALTRMRLAQPHQEPDKLRSAQMTGNIAAYLHLANDLYALDHNAELQEKLVARLRNRDNFDGARYEIYVAATLIRAGFAIAFEDEDDRSSTHCEFTATYDSTKRQFSVEAKHRVSNKFRFGRQLQRALKKKANHPRIVFIDVNMPASAGDLSKPMNDAMDDLMRFEGRKVSGPPLPPAYILLTNTPWHHHPDQTVIPLMAVAGGFQIPDFRSTPTPHLRGIIEARERHIEIYKLLYSMEEHVDIPSTFDGEIPEVAFGEMEQRLIIGERYAVRDKVGVERIGTLTTATVDEQNRKAWCAFHLDNGSAEIHHVPLSDAEMSAWKKHRDTFFGIPEQQRRQAKTPLDLYDFFLESYRKTPKERLLELLAGAPDIETLKSLDQPSLASIFSERSVYGAMNSTHQESKESGTQPPG